uniref:Uncharacterized protein n=1 Tax=Elaeophora elaphi TaxID=1147741 RepID=A0A0R3RP49_9BILA
MLTRTARCLLFLRDDSRNGKRPNQVYLPLNCRAKFRLNSDTINGYLRISSFHEKHKNHDNTEEDYLRVINKKKRKLIGDAKLKIMKEEKVEEISLTKIYEGCQLRKEFTDHSYRQSSITVNVSSC